MATELFANNASTTVSAGGTTAPASGTTETWTVASSASFPAASLALGAQFHVADPALPAEKIAVTNVSGATWTVTRGAESTAPAAHAAGFTVVQVVTAGTLGTFQQANPWQFLPEAYGAKGDGKVVADVSTTSASKVITSASAGFTAADVGKTVMINGGNGAAAAPYIDVIASVQSATQATLTTLSAGATATNCAMAWGTDDTAAFNSAFTAARSYAVANNWRAQVICRDRIYMLAAAPSQSTGPTYNSQVKIPFSDLTGATQKLMIDFIGTGHQGTAQFWQSTVPNLSGTCLVSTQAAPSTVDPTFGVQSVVGGPSGGGAFTAGFANTHFHVDGIAIFCPAYTNMKAWNLGFLAGATWGSFAANIFAPAVLGTKPALSDLPSQVAFQSTKGVGCIFPFTGNNDDVAGTRFAVEGYETGLVATDHFACLNLLTVYADLAWLIDQTQGPSGNANLVYAGNWSCEAYNGGLLCNGGNVTVDVRMTSETAGGADPSYDVKDQGSNLRGMLVVTDNNGRTNRRPVVVSCAALKVVNAMMGPGAWSGAPAVPASTVAQQNTSWRDAVVVVTGGTVSAVSVDGVAQGYTATGFTVIVPAGKTIAVTYTVAPTWKWTLL